MKKLQKKKKKKNGRFYREDGIWSWDSRDSELYLLVYLFSRHRKEMAFLMENTLGKGGTHRKLQMVLWEQGGSGKR